LPCLSRTAHRFGRETPKSKVAYWQTEETEEDAREDFVQSGMLPTHEKTLVILHPEPKEDHLKELNKFLVEDPDVRLVIIETLDDFLQIPDLSDNPDARRAFEKFDAEVVNQHKHRCCFVALHHFKKSDEQRGLNLNRILGATVIAGKTDAKMYLKQVSDIDPRRYIHAQIRKGIPFEPTYLNYDKMTQSSSLGMTLADEAAEAKKTTSGFSLVDLKDKAKQTIANNPGLSKRNIANKMGGRYQRALEIINELLADGKAEMFEDGLYLKGTRSVAALPIPEVPDKPLPVYRWNGWYNVLLQG
jgi:hypothetical protein